MPCPVRNWVALNIIYHLNVKGVIQMLHNTVGGGCREGVKFPGKNYEGVRFNVISVTRGWVGVNFPGKKAFRNT